MTEDSDGQRENYARCVNGISSREQTHDIAFSSKGEESSDDSDDKCCYTD